MVDALENLPVGLPGDVRAVFLSDVHLAEPQDANYRATLALLGQLDGLPDLYILGDFFDFWFGFSGVVPHRYVPVLARLKQMADAGTRIHFVEGNHDFHMGGYFTSVLGAVVHPESAEINLDGQRIYLAHGDTIDRDDHGYLRLRRVLRSRPVKRLANAMPPRWLLSFAGRLDRVAGGSMGGPSHLPALFREFARKKWASGYDGVILGHCHAPELLQEGLAERPCFYANLGDWLRHDTFLVYGGAGFSLRRAERP